MGTQSEKAYWVCAAALPLLYAALGMWQKASTGIQIELLLLVACAVPAHVARGLAWRGLLERPHPVWIGLEFAVLLGVGSLVVAEWSLLLAIVLLCAQAFRVGRPDQPAPQWLNVGARVAVGLGFVACCAFAAQGRPGGWARVLFALPFLAEAVLPSALASSGAAVRRLSVGVVLGALPLVRDGVLLELPLVPVIPLVPVVVIALVYRATPAPQRRKATRRWVVRIVFPLALLGLLWGLGELAFRVVPNSYATRNWGAEGSFHVPGETYVYTGSHLGKRQPRNVVTWNRHGWHDTDHELEKAPGSVRVLVMGDSFVEGIQVQLEQLYHKRLESELSAVSSRTVETMAYGWSGWGQAQEYEALTEGVELFHEDVQAPPALDFKPDLVVLGFLPSNDVRNNSHELEQLANTQSQRSTFARAWYSLAIRYGLPFTAFLCDKTDGFLKRILGQSEPVDADVYRREPLANVEEWAEAWEATASLVAEFEHALDVRGVPFVVVLFTGVTEFEGAIGGGVPEGADMEYPTERMAAVCEELGVPFLRLTPDFAKSKDVLFIDGDGHWTAEGHALAAGLTARFLSEETELWRRVLEER